MDTILIGLLKSIYYFFAAIFIHELGHLILGLVLKWRLYYISFGPVRISYSQVKGLRLNWISKLSSWGGALAIFPRAQADISRRELVMVVGAGPTISFIGALVFNETLPTLSYILLILGLITAIPYRKGNVYSDGGKIRRLFSKEWAEIELAGFRIGARVMADGSFASVSLEDLDRLVDSPDIRDRYRGTYYQTIYYRDKMDMGKFQEAQERLDEVRKLLPISLIKRLEESH